MYTNILNIMRWEENLQAVTTATPHACWRITDDSDGLWRHHALSAEHRNVSEVHTDVEGGGQNYADHYRQRQIPANNN